MKTKHNYPELKKQFLGSDHVELTPFLIEKGIIEKGSDMSQLSGNIRLKFAGWAEEKKQWLEGLFYEAKQAQGKKVKKEWDQVLDKVNGARRKILVGMANTIEKMSDQQIEHLVRKPDDILPVMRHFRLEAGESMDNAGQGINDRLIIALPQNGFESPHNPDKDE